MDSSCHRTLLHLLLLLLTDLSFVFFVLFPTYQLLSQQCHELEFSILSNFLFLDICSIIRIIQTGAEVLTGLSEILNMSFLIVMNCCEILTMASG